ncbi:MAG TPA: hypothetical protein VGK32_18515 [Vicinamibacterales bacterium]|jgi:hypothetical protein
MAPAENARAKQELRVLGLTKVVDDRAERVRDVMTIRLGAVTGDASYFLLTENEREAREIPKGALVPVVCRAHHLTSGKVSEEDWNLLRDAGEKAWLFRPTTSDSHLPAVKAYLGLRRNNGGCNRSAYKVRSREPWYQTPMPDVVDAFISGMSSWGPWLVFREMPGLSATNTLYVVRFAGAFSMDERAAWAMWLLTTDARRLLAERGRRYADGLVKFEPGDVANMPIRRPSQTHGAYAAYQRAVRLLTAGEGLRSQAIADEWFC